MEEIRFRAGEAVVWQAVVIASVRAGHHPDIAMAAADDAIRGLRERSR